MLRLFATTFDGHWPIGAGRVVLIAKDQQAAGDRIRLFLDQNGLKFQYIQALENLSEHDLSVPGIVDSGNGDY